MACTVQLLRHDKYCPISAEIRTVTVDSQSDLGILLYIVVMIKLIIIFNNYRKQIQGMTFTKSFPVYTKIKRTYC